MKLGIFNELADQTIIQNFTNPDQGVLDFWGPKIAVSHIGTPSRP
jgi:hypothetical protein